MPKPDKVLRFRPLKEVPEAVAKLKRVVLIHPKPIVEELKAKFCICGKGERKRGEKPKDMVQCDECWEWYHSDCADVADVVAVQNSDWKCEWCKNGVDKEGFQRWKSGRKKAKKRHRNDIPKLNGAVLGGDPAVRYSAPPSWEGKVEQVKEMARRAAIKKRKLTEAVEKLVDEGGHHLVDAEGMAGLELRPVNDGMIDEVLEAGLVADVNIGEND
jgi:PHD-finger